MAGDRMSAGEQYHCRLCNLVCEHPHRQLHRREPIVAAGHPEVHDTMVRETITYALSETWLAACRHPRPRLRLLGSDSPGDAS
jgi:hypothetical protein